ncbi:MAG TPA: hypothetical protein PKN63_07010, partial [Chitinophagales bacterium]|nr:hypothetical protein [Chitinophagales bacterium]
MKIVNITIIVSAILIGLITIGFLMFKKIKNYFRNWNDTKLKRELKKELDELLYKNGNPFHVADYDALLEKLTELRCKLYSRRLEIDEDKKARKEMRRIQVFMPIIDEKIEKLENIRAQVKKAVEMDERIALEDQKKRDENSAIVNSLQEKISTLVDIF